MASSLSTCLFVSCAAHNTRCSRWQPVGLTKDVVVDNDENNGGDMEDRTGRVLVRRGGTFMPTLTVPTPTPPTALDQENG